MMDHPNIAKVYDGGALDTPLAPAGRGVGGEGVGQPYFVMELVQGLAITDYCDQHQLDTRARLELFATVCRAVQHAHQKGIIHRDLKPSNIIVSEIDGAAVPKVIDFGVAKAVEPDAYRRDRLHALLPDGRHAALHEPGTSSGARRRSTSIRAATFTRLGVLLYELTDRLQTPFDRETL